MSVATILAALLVLCLVLVAWPFVVYPAILGLLPTRPIASGTVPRSASLLFCAYDEGAALPAKIANLRALRARYPALEILAFDDGSTDATGRLLDAADDVLMVVHGPGRSGKAHGMKLLASRATGEVLIFTDANVVLDETAIERLLPYYGDAAVGGVLGSLGYTGAGASASAGVGSLYWRIEERLKDAESRTGNVIGADGSIFSIRRALYPDFPDDVLDDFVVSMSVVFAGRRLVKAKDVRAHEAIAADRGEETRRKVRIAARAWRTHRYLRPRLRAMTLLDRFKYASRKLVRWFGALWIALGVVAAFGLAWLLHPLLAFLLAVKLGATAVIGMRARHGPFASLADIVFAYVATLRGIVLAMRGHDFTTWTPPASR